MANKTNTNKSVEITIVLSEEVGKALTTLKPTHKCGTDEGSFADCKKQFAYTYCGGKDKYNAKAYAVGEFIFLETYGKLLKDENFPKTLNPTEDKPTSASRGSSKQSKSVADAINGILAMNLPEDVKAKLISQLA